MSEWKTYKLGDVLNLKRGYDLPQKNRMAGTIPIISSSGVSGFHNQAKVHGPGVITGRYGTIGTIFYSKNDFWPLNTSLYVQDFKGNDVKFIFYFLKNFDFEQFNDKSAVPGINRNHVHEAPIILPPLPEQKAIASLFSSLDDKIDLLHRQNKNLEAMAETLFRQWFVEEARDDWQEVSLSEVTKVAIGRTPPRKEFHWFSKNPSDIKWVSIKDLGTSGVFVFGTSEYLTTEAVETFNIPFIPTETVLLSFKMTVGRVGITTEPMLSNEAIAHFKFNEMTPFTKEYLYLFLKTFRYDSLGSTSSIVTAINSAMIKEIEITIPDEETMNNFRCQTEPFFSKIYFNQNQIRTLEKFRDTLLPKLMSGEVRLEYEH